MATLSPIVSLPIIPQTHKQNFHFRSNPSLPVKFPHLCTPNFVSFHQNRRFGLCVLWGLSVGKNVILMDDERWMRWGMGKRVVLCRIGGGGGRRSDEGATVRVLGNVVLAVGLTYLSMNGKLGWILDTILSLWLLAFLVPIVGLGVLLWWAGRDMIQGTCPNCGNEFQILKFTVNEDVQLCPYCSQPFSVVDDEFVSDPVMFSNSSSPFEQTFSDFSRSKKGKDSQMGIVDIEAEVTDAE